MAVGSSPQQHRLSTGMFASKLCSSGWTPGSSGRARKNGHKSELSKTNYSWIGFVFKIFVIIVVVLLPSNLAPSPSPKPVPTKSGTYSSLVKDQFVGLGQRNSSIHINILVSSTGPTFYDNNHVTMQKGNMTNPGVDFTNCLRPMYKEYCTIEMVPRLVDSMGIHKPPTTDGFEVRPLFKKFGVGGTNNLNECDISNNCIYFRTFH